MFRTGREFVIPFKISKIITYSRRQIGHVSCNVKGKHCVYLVRTKNGCEVNKSQLKTRETNADKNYKSTIRNPLKN